MEPSTQDARPPSERFFAWLEKTIKERKDPQGTLQKLSRQFRKWLTVVTVAYFIFFLILLFLLGWWGERNWFLSILLFAPAIVWPLPLVLLAPFHLMVRPRLCWITLVALLVVLFVYLDFHWVFTTENSKSGLTLVTNNVGGRRAESLFEFLEKEDPDVVVLQDAWRYMAGVAKKYPERFVRHQGEYVFISKIPIRKSGVLNITFRGRPIGDWHELEYNGQSIVIFNIHMPTPRPEFEKLRGRGFLAELIGGKGIYSRETRDAYKEFVEKRIRLARDLADFLEKEERPFLVAGDFNMPANGYIRELFKRGLTDAFSAKGRGYGFTFPSGDKNSTSLFGPWLRLDYVFAGKDWKALFYRIESRQRAEHRAVVARFEFQPSAHKP